MLIRLCSAETGICTKIFLVYPENVVCATTLHTPPALPNTESKKVNVYLIAKLNSHKQLELMESCVSCVLLCIATKDWHPSITQILKVFVLRTY